MVYKTASFSGITKSSLLIAAMLIPKAPLAKDTFFLFPTLIKYKLF